MAHGARHKAKDLKNRFNNVQERDRINRISMLDIALHSFSIYSNDYKFLGLVPYALRRAP
jgi:hypothetical protein